MTLLTNRQQLARNLANEIGSYPDAWITSPMPLDGNAKLRLQVLDGERNKVLQAIRDFGFEPQFVSILPRVTAAGFAGAELWEVDLPKDRQAIADDRIHGEVVDPAKQAQQKAAVEAMYRSIYGKQGKRR